MPLSIDSLELPADLLWQDEFEWDSVTQKADRSVTGALLLQEGQMLHGRPITLVGTDRTAWMSRAGLLALQALADEVDTDHTLTLGDGRTVEVRFRRPAFKARPVIEYAVPVDSDPYVVEFIHLLTLGPIETPEPEEE